MFYSQCLSTDMASDDIVNLNIFSYTFILESNPHQRCLPHIVQEKASCISMRRERYCVGYFAAKFICAKSVNYSSERENACVISTEETFHVASSCCFGIAVNRPVTGRLQLITLYWECGN